MDLTSKRMYDIYKDHILKDLGALDPNWFDYLTAERLAGQASDQDELCANQEALFKTPIENRGPSSQMCSTPKLFKHHPTSSLQPENESFSAQPETLPWTKASPCVLQMEPSQRVDFFALHSPKIADADLHHSPGHSNTSFAKHISERLGATVGDISWTSSLNTPPPEPSTLILSRRESSSTVTLCDDSHVKCLLFPSNIKVAADRIILDTPEQITPIVPDAELNGSYIQAPMKDKPVPSATEDVDAQNEVPTENATFCTKSSSILRKVRSERVNRRLILPSNENTCGTVKMSPVKTTEPNEDKCGGNPGLSQWSPLSLSEIQTHDSGPKDKRDEKENSHEGGCHEAQSKEFPATEQNREHTLDNVTKKPLQRSLNFSGVSDPTPLSTGFSPAACLSALKRAKKRAKRGHGFNPCDISVRDSESTLRQSSVPDSGFSSVAETALISSNKNSLFKQDTSDLEKEVTCEAICRTVKGLENKLSDVVCFKTASNKDINVSPQSLTKAKHFLNDAEEEENVSLLRSDTSNEDAHLTVSQKAEVKELCALLEQQSSNHFEFTQRSVENRNQSSSQKSLETDFETDKSTNRISRTHHELSQQPNEPRPNTKLGDHAADRFEDDDLNTCHGFKTANGKGIGISDTSMQKSLNLFKDCDMVIKDVALWNVTEDKNGSGCKNTSVVGSIHPKEDHNTATLKKPCFNVSECVKANENVKPMGKSDTFLTPHRGFKRPRDIHPVSAKSVKRVKLLGPNCGGEERLNLYLNLDEPNKSGGTDITNINNAVSPGFTTAHGKRVQLSKKDFKKVEHLWKDFDTGLKSTNWVNPTHQIEAPNLESTAGSKALDTEHDSDDPQRKTKLLHNYTSRKADAITKVYELVDCESKAYSKLPDHSDSAPGTSRLLSASGKIIGVSAEATFDDMSYVSETRLSPQSPKAITLAQSTKNCEAQGNKTITANSKRSDNCTSSHLSVLSAECDSRFPNPVSDNCPLQIGFTTASGKKVAISEEALNVAQRLLAEDAESANVSLNKSIQCNNPQLKKGTATLAVGKTISVKSVLAKALHSTNTRTVNETSMVETPACAQMYEPRNPSNIEINHITTVDARNNDGFNFHLEDSVDLAKLDVPASNISCVKNGTSGFCTASGKTLTVSEEALNKAVCFLTEKNDLGSDAKVQVTQKDKDDLGLRLEQSVTNMNHADISSVKNRSEFTTASEKIVTISEEALTKANNFLTENADQDSYRNVHVTEKTKGSSSLSPGWSDSNTISNIFCENNSRSGFSTASGKKVKISEEALNKAKNFLTENVDQGSDADLHKMKKGSSLPFGHSATNLRSTSSNSSCIKAGSHGFSTASGQKVTISEEALTKAMKFLTENVDEDSDASIQKKEKGMVMVNGLDLYSAFPPTVGTQSAQGMTLPLGPSFSNLDNTPMNISSDNTGRSGFSTASGKKVVISEEALNKARNFLTENVDQDNDANVQKQKKGSSLPLGHSVANFDSTISDISNSGRGFSTASGKKVTISEEAVVKAKNFLTDNVDQDNDANAPNKKKSADLPSVTILDDMSSNMSCVKTRSGFSTASGKKVTISEEALNKAVNFLSEKIDQDNDANLHKNEGLRLPLGQSETNLANTSSNIVHGKTGGSGFSTASGNKVIISEEALNKARNFLTEKIDQDIDANVHVKKKDHLPLGHSFDNLDDAAASNNLRNRSGFSTASGKKVIVMDKALNKAKNFLTGEVDQDSDVVHDRPSPGQSVPTLDNMSPNISSVKTSRSGFSTANGKKVTVSEEALNKAMNFLSDKNEEDGDAKCFTAEPVLRDSNGTILPRSFVQPEFSNGAYNSLNTFTSDLNRPVEMDVMEAPSVSLNIQKDAVLFAEDNQNKSLNKRSQPQCSMVNLDLPNLSDCTTTQQKFLAQEALDCTRALLEDEVRAAQTLTASLEHNLTPEKATDLPGLGKKSPEDSDGALDRQKESVLNPVKSCFNVLCKDRRVFQYHTPLRPNVTKSHRFGKDLVNTQKLASVVSTPVKNGQADLKSPLFVPPFLNTRAKTPKVVISAQKDKEKHNTFVPPFKKFKSDGNSLKMQHVDSNCVKGSPKTSTFTPPTRKNPKNDCRSEPDAFPDRTNETEMTNESEDAQIVHGLEEMEQEANVKETEETKLKETLLNPESVDLARDLQDMRIRKKSRQTIRPIPGSLFLTKSSENRRSFRAVVNGQTPQKYSQQQLYTYGVDQSVCGITSETAEEFRFNLLKFYKQELFSEAGAVQLADGGWLVPRRDGTVGKDEFYRALCDSPGVDPKLLSQRWVSNHYRWVVWKLASMERAFPASMACVCLSPEQVLLQLKYRYDVEVDHSRRPCLRKIMERDDTSAKTLVLCVCGTVSRGTPQDAKVKPEQPGAVLWLTDGWYSIKAQLDDPLTALLHRGAISEGVKLMTHGAQLVGSQEACPPLDAPESLMLKICANSTRRVRWDTRLGFSKDPRPFALPLSSVFGAGGVVCCVDLLLLRVYPVQWMERKPDGGVVFRSERAEEKEARRYNNQKQKTMEAVYAKIKAEFEKEEKETLKSRGRRRTVRREDLCRCQDGEELFEAVGDEAADVEALLTAEQLQSLSVYRRTLLDQRQAKLQERLRRAMEEAEASEGSCPKRDVSAVWRLGISDYRDQASSTVYQLSIWNPTPDLQVALKEGRRYEASNLMASEGRTPSGWATVQLTSTRKTHFRNLQASPERLLTCFQPRVSVPFAELQRPDFQPLCGEVDLTGCVVSITDQHGPSPCFYLADGGLNLVKVHSLNSFARCGWEDVLACRGLVCLTNLQVRLGCAGPTPVLYAGDMSALSTHPREGHLRLALSQLQRDVQDQEDFFVKAEKRLFEILSSDGLSFPAVNPRTPQSTKTSGYDLRTSVVKRQAAAFTPPVRTPVAPDPLPKKDPRSLKRRRALDYLCQFPPPPPLSRLSSGVSPGAKKTFLPPRRSLTSAPGAAAQTPRSSPAPGTSAPGTGPEEDGWVHDDELALIDTQELRAADALLD